MSSPLPPLNALRAFEAIARHLSFAKAANELQVTPAALSHQIRALEEQLGLRLVPEKSMVNILVIDHIERPTPNP